jgi:hypothetical protein
VGHRCGPCGRLGVIRVDLMAVVEAVGEALAWISVEPVAVEVARDRGVGRTGNFGSLSAFKSKSSY